MRALSSLLVIVSLSACGGAAKPESTTTPEATKATAAQKEALRLFEEGKQAYAAGDVETAIARWEAGYAAKPDPVFQFNLGQAERKAERPQKAAEHLRKYLEEAPKAPNRAAVEQALKEIDVEMARAESQRLFESGNQLFRDGKNDEAIAEWEAGYAKAPSAAFLYNIGQAHRAAGRKEEARKYLQRYLDEAPTTPRRAEVEKLLKQLDVKPRR